MYLFIYLITRLYLLDSHGYQTDDQFGTSSGDPHLSRCCDASSSSSPCITTNICHVNQNLAMGQTHSHLPQNHSPRDAANQSSCFQSPSVTTTEIGNRYNCCLHFSVNQLSPTAIYIRPIYLYTDDDVSGSCSGKYDTSMHTMNSSSSNLIHQASSSHPLFGFENCGSASTIEELNFSVLHNVSSQNNLSNETRKLLKKR